MQFCALRRRGASAYPLQAVTRDECRGYLVWQLFFSCVPNQFIFNGAGGGNRTIRAYSFYVTYCKHTNARTAQPAVCPLPMYKIMYKKFEGRLSRRHLNTGLRSSPFPIDLGSQSRHLKRIGYCELSGTKRLLGFVHKVDQLQSAKDVSGRTRDLQSNRFDGVHGWVEFLKGRIAIRFI